MPYVSAKQRRYFHTNRKKLEAQGVNVAEWDAASRNKKLPEQAPKMSKKTASELVNTDPETLALRLALLCKLAQEAMPEAMPESPAPEMAPKPTTNPQPSLRGLASQGLSFLNNNLPLGLAAGGALGGAALGGVSSLFRRKSKKRVLDNMLSGGLAGAATGFGAGALAKSLTSAKSVGDLAKLFNPETPAAGSAGEAVGTKSPEDILVDKIDSPEALRELGEKIKPVRSLSSSTVNAAKDTLGSAFGAVAPTDFTTKTTRSLGLMSGLMSAREMLARHLTRTGKVRMFQPGSLVNPQAGYRSPSPALPVSVNVLDEASEALTKALRITDGKKRLEALRKLIPSDIVQLADAELEPYARHVLSQAEDVLAPAIPGVRPGYGPQTGAQRLYTAAGSIPHAVTPNVTATPAQVQATLANAGAHGSPYWAYDLPFAKHIPTVNKYFRKIGPKAIPAAAGLAEIIAEARRINAQNAQRAALLGAE